MYSADLNTPGFTVLKAEGDLESIVILFIKFPPFLRNKLIDNYLFYHFPSAN